jgi:hypothetical protein
MTLTGSFWRRPHFLSNEGILDGSVGLDGIDGPPTRSERIPRDAVQMDDES